MILQKNNSVHANKFTGIFLRNILLQKFVSNFHSIWASQSSFFFLTNTQSFLDRIWWKKLWFYLSFTNYTIFTEKKKKNEASIVLKLFSDWGVKTELSLVKIELIFFFYIFSKNCLISILLSSH